MPHRKLTSAEKKAISRRMKKYHHNLKEQRNHVPSLSAEEASLAYALGRVEQFIEDYSRNASIPSSTLAYRLGQALLRSARRPVRGTGG